MGEKLIIGTHDGKFHADEALACFLLKLLPEYKNASIIRTRDPLLLQKCSIVVDVGAIYDPSKLLFDHHQREFNEFFSPSYKTKLSSAGLIYKHFGKRVLKEVILPSAIVEHNHSRSFDESMVDIIYEKLYKDCIEEFDAVDNGISAYPSDVAPLFRIGSTSVFSQVSLLNPSWTRFSGTVDQDQEAKITMQQFEKAMELTGTAVMNVLDDLVNSWWPARKMVLDAYNTRCSADDSGKIMLLEQSCPWKDHLFDMEENGQLLYVIYPDNLHNNWRMQAVPIQPDSFVSRKPFLESWCGLRDKELDKVTNVPGGIFIHSTGFIGGHSTKQGALELCRLAIRQ